MLESIVESKVTDFGCDPPEDNNFPRWSTALRLDLLDRETLFGKRLNDELRLVVGDGPAFSGEARLRADERVPEDEDLNAMKRGLPR